MIRIVLDNSTAEDGTFFFRGRSITQLYIDSNNIVNDIQYNCTGVADGSLPNPSGSKYNAVPLPVSTFYFEIKQGKQKVITMPEQAVIDSGIVWYVHQSSTQLQRLSRGPEICTMGEFTITNVVSYDLTFVDGVSHGLRMIWKPAEGSNVEVQCVPKKPRALQSRNTFGFNTIPSDKHTSTEPEAGCASNLADTVCGQHKCRKWYAKQYENPDSYCSWLESNNCQGYCWAMDEWKCTDASCGYGGVGQPTDCQLFENQPKPPYFPNTYSCGHGTNLPGPDGNTYWSQGPGCTDKDVSGAPTNPILPRKATGGDFIIKFIELEWLSGKTVPNDPVDPVDPVNTGKISNSIIFGVLGGFIILCIIVFVMYKVLRNK
jgi:hypothetical protein